jgi:hypothetical protein
MRRSDIRMAEKIESVADVRDLAARRLPKGSDLHAAVLGHEISMPAIIFLQMGHRDALAA